MSKIALALLPLALGGCAGFAFAGHHTPMGTIYTKASTGEQVTDNPIGTKTGEACAMSVLGMVTTGDASISAAAANGRITTIGAVEHSFKNIVGIWSQYCVRVRGE